MNRKYLIAAAIIGALPLAACGPKTPAAENALANAEATADTLDNQAAEIRSDAGNTVDAIESGAENRADAVENKAAAVRDAGANTAEKIDEKAGH
ncbi:hypothetical protein [Sphingomonas sp. G-3-2-10]|uniref:hypothetical protein n=1 Tax=Sphingomonas sp. G-3-2-10 TaxID=2728838 RepID=UPI00146D2F85|nr:hypothetical protein [Sphingomonas sp. G-3-2-10]NML05092.1 hypothetical protein [Sphingomonas sp. G-3-2-10]